MKNNKSYQEILNEISPYDYSKKNEVSNHTIVVCLNCHEKLTVYGGCKTCNLKILKEWRNNEKSTY